MKRKKTKSFCLSLSVIDMLEDEAAEYGISESSIVNRILINHFKSIYGGTGSWREKRDINHPYNENTQE